MATALAPAVVAPKGMPRKPTTGPQATAASTPPAGAGASGTPAPPLPDHVFRPKAKEDAAATTVGMLAATSRGQAKSLASGPPKQTVLREEVSAAQAIKRPKMLSFDEDM